MNSNFHQASVVLQTSATAEDGEQSRIIKAEGQTNDTTNKVKPSPKPFDVLEAVEYRLSITDLFVEKAQYHLEKRAKRYKWLGYAMYLLALLLLATGTRIAYNRMPNGASHSEASFNIKVNLQPDLFNLLNNPASLTTPASAVTLVQTPAAFSKDGGKSYISSEIIGLFERFIKAFTAYGFIVLTAVALIRGARACLDQQERLLSKRHSLRQGRLYLHLSGGSVTINDLERAFNWNHEQHNAFTNMPTDAKAPWGNVLDEIIKIVPELVKTGVNAAEKKKGN